VSVLVPPASAAGAPLSAPERAVFRPRGDAPVGVVLGAMNFGKRIDEALSRRIVARAAERGVALVDTANAYNEGASEEIVGRALREHPSLLVATKVGFGRVNGKPEGLSGQRVLAACDESLGRLGRDSVDLYYLHAPDYTVPLTETLGAVKTLLDSGKIRRWGMSNYASWQILEARLLADELGLPHPVVSQVIYNPLVRPIEVEYARFTKQYPIHTTVYNALAGGLLSGRHQRDQEPPKGTRFDNNAFYRKRYWSDRFFDLVDAYAELSRSADKSLVDLVYGWLGGRPVVDTVLVGPTSVEQLDQAIDGLAAPLPKELVKQMDDIHRGFQGTDAVYAR
jgi:aryl-alcohol dehydrogenase-like predicted oxidoreductase